MTKCKVCSGEMNTGAVGDRDCGGDCLQCLADCGDLDCKESLVLDSIDRISRVVRKMLEEVNNEWGENERISHILEYARMKFNFEENWNGKH